MIHILRINCCKKYIDQKNQTDKQIDIIYNTKEVHYILKKEIIMFDLYFNVLLDKYIMFKYVGPFASPGTGSKKEFIEQNQKQIIDFIKHIDENDVNIAKQQLLSLYLFGDKSLEKKVSMDDLYEEHSSHINEKMINNNDKKYVNMYFVHLDLIIMYILNKIDKIFNIFNSNKSKINILYNFRKSTDTLMLFVKLFNFLTFFISMKVSAQESMIILGNISIDFVENFYNFMQKYLKFFSNHFFQDLLDKIINIVQCISPNQFNDKNNINHYISTLMVTVSVVNTFVIAFNSFLWSFNILDIENFTFLDKEIQQIYKTTEPFKHIVSMVPTIQNTSTSTKNYFLVWKNNLDNMLLFIIKQTEKSGEFTDIKSGIFCFYKLVPDILNKIKQTYENCLTNQLNILQLQFYNNINYKTININQFRKLKRKYEDIRNINNKDDIVTDTIVKKNKIEK